MFKFVSAMAPSAYTTEIERKEGEKKRGGGVGRERDSEAGVCGWGWGVEREGRQAGTKS